MRMMIALTACVVSQFACLMLSAQEVASRGASPSPLGAIPPASIRENNTPAKSGATAAARAAGNAPDSGFTPSWETQKQARTYLLGIPAPRGQIVDRNGNPLAQTRVSYNLAISFPTPLRFSDNEALAYIRQETHRAELLLGRQIHVPENGLKHYKNRGVLPLVIASDLRPGELETIKQQNSPNLTLQPVYQRYYPHGTLAGHVVGYAGRAGRPSDKPIENNELLWPNAEGRDGLEQTFDEQLQGKVGQYNISFDSIGRKAAEQISIPPQPGYNVVTTLDLGIQRLCEESLEKGTKRGAIVVLDPNNGEILALASWPTINPNDFVPAISTEAFRALQEDKDIPLLPRAFRSAYPPGSTFKVFVGLAALQSGRIAPDDEFSCPPAIEIGNLTFRNWKKEHAGMLNFADALTQSCNTWFYQVGLKIGGRIIGEYAHRLGLGSKTGIPLNAEAEGRIPTDEYMMKTYKRRLLNGDVANLSIGQGDTIITPLQMAQAMGAVANGGTLYQTRLVQQVQSLDDQIVHAYGVRARAQIDISNTVMNEIRRGMVQVVESRAGTAGRAEVPGVHLAGKTGTAQWGPKNNERTAAWFAGFVPADKPKYAFAALYEGEAKEDDTHGGTQAAPLIGRVMRELFKEEPREKSKKKRRPSTGPKEEEEMIDGVPVRRAAPVHSDDPR
jgi:penicillin-binding protein 2